MKKFLTIVAVAALFVSYASAVEITWSGYSQMYSFVDVTMPDSGDSEVAFALSPSMHPLLKAIIKVSETFEARAEIGYGPTDTRTVIGRHIYGNWKINDKMSLLVGQTATPVYSLFSGQMYADGNALLGYGAVYTGRRSMVQFSYSGLKIAAIQAEDPLADKDKKIAELLVADPSMEQTATLNVPKFEASYKIKSDLYSFTAFGGFQPYTITFKDSAFLKEDVPVSIFAAGFEGSLTLTKIGLNVAFAYSSNGYNYGMTLHGNNKPYGKVVYDRAKDEILNAMTLFVPFNLTYTASDKISTEVGFGMSMAKSGKENAEAVSVMGAYGNVTFTLDPNVQLIPEISYVIGGEDKNTKTTNANSLGIGFCLSTNF